MKPLLFCLLVSVPFVLAADSPSFRGPQRNGKFPETGLLKTWPLAGPTEVWSITGLGESYASVSVVGNTIYTTGKNELEGYLFAISTSGKLLWQTRYGNESDGKGYPGTRSTPEISGDKLYFFTGPGKLLALKTLDGSKVWERDILKDFEGTNPNFFYSESVLVDGDNVICMPGGKGASVVALNKNTGETVWRTKDVSDKASYCSARIFDNGTIRQVIVLTAVSMLGIDPKTGDVHWRYEYPTKYDIHAVSPVFQGNSLYVSDGSKQGGKAFALAEDGKSVRLLWEEKSLDVLLGGVVQHEGYLYGSSSGGTWMCLDFKTGAVLARSRDLGQGAVIFADGLLYGYDEKGMVALIDPNPKNFKSISYFQVEKGSGQHWSHPVIVNKRLYIRHGSDLICYDIAAS